MEKQATREILTVSYRCKWCGKDIYLGTSDIWLDYERRDFICSENTSDNAKHEPIP